MTDICRNLSRDGGVFDLVWALREWRLEQCRFILTTCYDRCYYFHSHLRYVLMMASALSSLSVTTTSSTKKRSSTQAMQPPSSTKVAKSSNVQSSPRLLPTPPSPQVKDASVVDDLLTHILLEAATAVKVRPSEKKEQQQQEEEDQVGNGHRDNYSFSSTVHSSFVLGYRQDCEMDIVGEKITIYPSGNHH